MGQKPTKNAMLIALHHEVFSWRLQFVEEAIQELLSNRDSPKLWLNQLRSTS
jgi:hypothetical protein